MTGVLLLAALTLMVPAVGQAQTDDQTREIQERDRSYYERQAAQQEAAQVDRAAEAEKVRLAMIQEADTIIRDRNYSGKAGKHYKVQTDDPRLSTAASVQLLEAFRAYFEGFWAEQLPLAPYEETSRVYLFYSYFKYNRLLTGKERFDEFRTAGHYRTFFDVVVVHTDSVPGGLGDVLVHEAAHQLTAQQLFAEVGGVTSSWLSEGLASYFGFTFQGPDGTFQPGVIGGKSAALFPNAKRTQAGNGWERVQQFRKGWKKGKSWPLGDLLAMDPAMFYGESVEQNYAASWMLVHYLLHGKGGAHREGFVRFLEHEKQGQTGPEVLYADLGVSREDLARDFTDHVRRLKPDLRKSR
jgi:hypothetical protein